jgi:deazaflavin-dependent oxidoreductase (nitroreductase family)
MLGHPAKNSLIRAEELLKNVPPLDPAVAQESYCYLTTTGRVSGEPREIEIWFGLVGATVYLLSGGGDRSNWVRNLRRDPAVTVRIAGTTWPGRARMVEDAGEAERARTLLVDKYAPGYSGDLEGWRQRALPVAIDLEASDD